MVMFIKKYFLKSYSNTDINDNHKAPTGLVMNPLKYVSNLDKIVLL